MKSSIIYSKSLPGSEKRDARGYELINKNITIEKSIARTGPDSISVTLTMTKTISMTKKIPLFANTAR
ncbi:MAG: hypothetical protein ACM3U1_00775 [Chloroflexota bacterium]